jgi:hypothetical protein
MGVPTGVSVGVVRVAAVDASVGVLVGGGCCNGAAEAVDHELLGPLSMGMTSTARKMQIAKRERFIVVLSLRMGFLFAPKCIRFDIK